VLVAVARQPVEDVVGPRVVDGEKLLPQQRGERERGRGREGTGDERWEPCCEREERGERREARGERREERGEREARGGVVHA